ncbi:MAG: hypothetical protein K8R88_01430 [Armatimonadetes bacterium]|nr:hypothetical protein [Armatimonadota bacterium]
MARRVSLDPIQLLVTHKEAARMLGCTETRILLLIQQGKLAEHPFEDGKIARSLVEAYATNYVNGQTDEQNKSNLRQRSEPVEEASAYGFQRAI